MACWNYNLYQGLAEELSKEGACDRAIFPDSDIVVDRCALIGNLTVEGVSKLNIRIVLLFEIKSYMIWPEYDCRVIDAIWTSF